MFFYGNFSRIRFCHYNFVSGKPVIQPRDVRAIGFSRMPDSILTNVILETLPGNRNDNNHSNNGDDNNNNACGQIEFRVVGGRERIRRNDRGTCSVR